MGDIFPLQYYPVGLLIQPYCLRIRHHIFLEQSQALLESKVSGRRLTDTMTNLLLKGDVRGS